MLLSLILTGLLSSAQGAAAPSTQAAPPPTHTAASDLAQSGEYAQALDAFRRIAAANPADVDARIWIARLHVQMGHPELAAPVFHAIVLEDPSRVDAIIGLGLTLATNGTPETAIDVLERAEQVAPENPEVIAALGRAYRRAGYTGTSLAYLERAVTLSPTPDNRTLLEQARLSHGHRVEIGSFYEDFTGGVASTRSADLGVSLRLNDRVRLSGRGQYQRKFGEDEARGGIGLDWRWRPDTITGAHVWIGPGNDVLPELDARVEASHMADVTEWAAGLRFFRFGVADVTVFSPSVTWWATSRLCVGLRYSMGITNFDSALLDTEQSHSGTLQGAYRVHPRVWAMLGYSRGVEDFDTFSVDRIGEFDADTASGGFRVDLPTLSSLIGTYEHQWRRGGIQMGRFRLSFAQRF